MPKKWRKRMEDIACLENAKKAFSWVYSHTKPNKRFTYSDDALLHLCNKLLEGSWFPGDPLEWDHYEPNSDKWRHIVEPTYETKIVERMVLQIYMPYVCKFLHPGMCGSIPKRGTKRVRNTVKRWLKLPKKQRKYFAHGDIKKCFYSIRIEDAMREWKRHIGDTRVHSLLWELMTMHGRFTIGLCIGAALAHPTANLVLHSIAIRVGGHIVFQMDDFAFIGGNLRRMKRVLDDIVTYAHDVLHLVVHKMSISKWAKEPIDIAGYRIFWQGKVRVRKQTFRKVMRQADNFDLCRRQRTRLGSMYGMIKATTSMRLRLYIKEKLADVRRKRLELKNGSLLNSRTGRQDILLCQAI